MNIELPTEIWISILKEVTRIPGELNVDALSLFDEPSPSEARKSRAILLLTRRSIVCVSRLFYSIGIEFLYQSITITRARTIPRLLRALQSPSSLGRRVKRLDVYMAEYRWEAVNPGTFIDLLRCIPNVQYLAAPGYSVLSEILDGSIEICCPNLVTLKISENCLESADKSEKTLALITKLPHLHFFDTPYFVSNILHCLPTKLKFRKITAPTTGSELQGNLPDLVALIIGSVTDRTDEGFLETYGHKIHTMSLSIWFLDTFFGRQNLLPNLRDVIIDLQAPYMPKSVLERIEWYPSFPQVRRVGFTMENYQARPGWLKDAFQLIRILFPKIDIIRVSQIAIADRILLFRRARLLRLKQEFQQLNIRLEREDGELLIAS